MDFQKAMLEELMSQYVDVDNKDFWDDSVCKHYLVAYCPSQLFTNTKSDLGPCDKIHNDRLKERYQNAPDKHKYPYEAEFYDYLNKLVNDLGRRIRNGKGRLNIQGEDKLAENRKEEREEKMVLLDVKIKEMLQKIEEAGEEGRVQEAADLTTEVEKLQAELSQLKENADSGKSEKRMEVCQVCGAFLVTNDSSDRLEAHYQGKQHQGYLKIRETLDQIKQSKQFGGRDRDYTRARYDYRNDRRDGGRERDHRRYSDRDRGYRERDDHGRRSRDRRGGGDDDWDREMERYNRRSRHYDDDYPRRSRSRSPRRSRYD
ncbi:luc7-like protein 3 [Lichtheimia corymbifera JMRC:FSU:9682]|uniref:Luc7-like protein 3 n=1 Tax=Lichtheimia corymbifera JMRC:FSU:9682 TaxID=1263082 RepID=A0A068RJQ6_9FUNG|nr:luc7-like protein 3 [Lichtheimia corymbifera JMRC:FSU:9682]